MRGRGGTMIWLCTVVAAAMPSVAAADGVPPGVVQGGDGVSGPAHDVRYVAIGAGPRTALLAIRRHGGGVVRSRLLAGAFGVPMVTVSGATDGLSADGRTLVLEMVRRAPPRRGVSRFVVLSTATLRPHRRIAIRGDFSFDALSPDARTMYLVEHTAEGDPTPYRVRSYDLATRRLSPRTIVDRYEPDEEMVGSPLARATQPDGGWVYTLYQRPSGEAFVHALDTRRARARCIDLPWTGAPDLGRVRMLIDGRGALALVRERATRIALIDPRTFALRAAPGPDGKGV